MPARLAVHLADAAVRLWHLEENREYLVGRHEDAEIEIADERVSSQHLALESRDGEWSARDLGSKNGTLVEGRPLHGATPLARAAWMSLGGVLVRFEKASDRDLQSDLTGAVQRWQSSVALQRRLDPGLGVDELLERLLDSVLELSRAERGLVLLHRSDGELEIRVRRSLEVRELLDRQFSGSARAVERALADRRPVVLSDALEDTELAARESILGNGIRTLVCLPLLAGEELIGAIYADSRAVSGHITELDLEILEALSRQAALALRLALLEGEVDSVVGRLSTKLRDQPELAAWIARELAGVGVAAQGAGAHETPALPTARPQVETWSTILDTHSGVAR